MRKCQPPLCFLRRRTKKEVNKPGKSRGQSEHENQFKINHLLMARDKFIMK